MKLTFAKFLAATAVLGAMQMASAQTLFTDNFTVDSPSGFPATPSTGANYELNFPGRQGGTLATPTLDYINGFVRDGNEQLGHLTALSPAPGNPQGNGLLLANLGSVRINYDFSAIAGAITVNFDGNVKSGNATDWLAFMIGTVDQNQFIVDSTAGILFRENGGTQIFDHGSGSDGVAGVAPGNDVWQSYSVVISDWDGTGSAFNGNGSMLTYYANGVLLGSALLSQLNAGEGYFAFGASDQLAGVANLSISTNPVPEPSSFGLAMVAAIGGIALMRRRLRA
jgi:hypothetical protein